MERGNQNIFLVGMPSSGKSTLGRKLAAEIGANFIETDDVIVNQQGKSIWEIFQTHGESYFRDLERDLLHSIAPNQNLVVSTGGGLPCFHHNIDYILANGLSIYIHVSVPVLYDRMVNSNKNDRPLIDLSDREKLLENLNQRFEIRHPIYAKANIEILKNFTVEHLIQSIMEYKNNTLKKS